MRESDYIKALLDPRKFVMKHITSNKLKSSDIAKEIDLPLNTIRSFVQGYRPNPATTTITALMRFVLKEKGVAVEKFK